LYVTIRFFIIFIIFIFHFFFNLKIQNQFGRNAVYSH
jgi:hypothetical protein